MADLADEVANEIVSDPLMARAASTLGTSREALLPRPLASFAQRGDEPESILEVRLAHYERRRASLASQLRKKHRALAAKVEKEENAEERRAMLSELSSSESGFPPGGSLGLISLGPSASRERLHEGDKQRLELLLRRPRDGAKPSKQEEAERMERREQVERRLENARQRRLQRLATPSIAREHRRLFREAQMDNQDRMWASEYHNTQDLRRRFQEEDERDSGRRRERKLLIEQQRLSSLSSSMQRQMVIMSRTPDWQTKLRSGLYSEISLPKLGRDGSFKRPSTRA
jgi:hypothetical protein